MSIRKSSAKRGPVPASDILSALAKDLSTIKHEDRLTYADLGRVIGKSDDQAAKYCDGTAEMSITSYYFAKQAWNGRFTGTADALIGYPHDDTCDHSKQSKLLAAALALSVALEDGEITNDEIRSNRKTLENAKHAIDELLGRIMPKAVG